MDKWKTLGKEEIYKNKWITITEDQVIQPDGTKGIYSYLEKPPGVFVVALNKKNEIYMVEQYRYVIKTAILELPAGVVIPELSVEENAAKELYEETGIKADKLTFLGKFWMAPGHETTYINTFLAEDLDESEIKIHQEGDESILSVKKFSTPKMKEMILNNEINCGPSLASLNMFFQYKERQSL